MAFLGTFNWIDTRGYVIIWIEASCLAPNRIYHLSRGFSLGLNIYYEHCTLYITSRERKAPINLIGRARSARANKNRASKKESQSNACKLARANQVLSPRNAGTRSINPNPNPNLNSITRFGTAGSTCSSLSSSESCWESGSGAPERMCSRPSWIIWVG